MTGESEIETSSMNCNPDVESEVNDGTSAFPIPVTGSSGRVEHAGGNGAWYSPGCRWRVE